MINNRSGIYLFKEITLKKNEIRNYFFKNYIIYCLLVSDKKFRIYS